MESATKFSWTKEQLQQAVQQATKQDMTEAQELSDGWANSAYIIRLKNGQQVVLKSAPADETHLMGYEKTDMLRTEVEALRLFSRSGTVPVPQVIADDNSKSIVSTHYYIMEFLEGAPYNKIKENLATEERDTINRKLGEISRQINDVQNDRFGFFWDTVSTDWQSTFTRMIDSVLADGAAAGISLPTDYTRITAEIRARLDALQEVKTPCLVHWDLWDGNAFVHEGRITGIIDFERAFWGDPLMEFYFGRMGRSEEFLDGYGKTALTENERIRRGLYDLYLDLILRIECHYRAYTNQGHINWTEENLQYGWNQFLSIR
ncbi:phosphotransferase family protein [Gorillibacterium massiliense]|uniref:phosphotransferase family protein n=1 Tax=Gorillibacterium massiliense TaxID=1280390 RepID=UPI0004B24D16|nr:aminoglycoside phosphotransferase family protein [Gorillibacterium massiliense]